MKKVTNTLFLLLMMMSANSFAQTDLRAPFNLTVPVIDGNIGASEWQNASQYTLTFYYYPDGSTISMPAWFLNDGSYLYAASRVPLQTDPSFYFQVSINGDHSHTLNGNATAPHVTIYYNKAGTSTPSLSIYNEYGYWRPGCASYGTTPPAGAQHAFSGSNPLYFEFRIPLSDLTVQPGGTVGLFLGIGADGTYGHNYSYPVRVPCNDISQWANLVIETESSANNTPFCDSFDGGLADWTPFHSTPIPTIVTSPVRGGSGQAVRFQTCWPAMYRTGLEAVAGYYSGWVYQTNTYQQGAEFVIQSDFDGTNWMGSRYYDLDFSALGTPGGGFMRLTRRENAAQTSYASKPVTFQRNEWVQIFIDRRLPDTIIAGYQRTTGFRDSILYVDPNPLMTPGKFIIMSCGQDANNAYIWDDICYNTPAAQPAPQYFAGTGHWYQVVPTPQVMCWPDARDAAVAMGGYLATIKSEEENEFIISLDPPGEHVTLIGGSESPEGVWRWVDGSVFYRNGVSEQFCKWGPLEPNGYASLDYLELWVTANQYARTWNDTAPCDANSKSFIVEYDHDPSVPLPPGNYSEAEFGGSHCFNGTDDYISVANHASLNFTDALTIEAWVNLDQLPPNTQPLLAEYAIVSKWMGPGVGRWMLGIEGAPYTGQIRFDLPGKSMFSTRTISAGEWHHIAATYDGNNVTIFIDGHPDKTEPFNGGLGSSTSELAIGKNIHNNHDLGVGAYFFKGKIDEVRISNIARTPSEFALTAPSSPDENTMALWHMDETGTKNEDASMHHNNGTAFGGGCVVRPPIIGLSVQNIDFGQVEKWTEASQTIIISNSGVATLLILGVQSSNGAIQAIHPINIVGGTSATMSVIVNPDDEILYDCDLTISSNDPRQPLIHLPVRVQGITEQQVGWNHVKASLKPITPCGNGQNPEPSQVDVPYQIRLVRYKEGPQSHNYIYELNVEANDEATNQWPVEDGWIDATHGHKYQYFNDMPAILRVAYTDEGASAGTPSYTVFASDPEVCNALSCRLVEYSDITENLDPNSESRGSLCSRINCAEAGINCGFDIISNLLELGVAFDLAASVGVPIIARGVTGGFRPTTSWEPSLGWVKEDLVDEVLNDSLSFFIPLKSGKENRRLRIKLPITVSKDTRVVISLIAQPGYNQQDPCLEFSVTDPKLEVAFVDRILIGQPISYNYLPCPINLEREPLASRSDYVGPAFTPKLCYEGEGTCPDCYIPPDSKLRKAPYVVTLYGPESSLNSVEEYGIDLEIVRRPPLDQPRNLDYEKRGMMGINGSLIIIYQDGELEGVQTNHISKWLVDSRNRIQEWPKVDCEESFIGELAISLLMAIEVAICPPLGIPMTALSCADDFSDAGHVSALGFPKDKWLDWTNYYNFVNTNGIDGDGFDVIQIPLYFEQDQPFSCSIGAKRPQDYGITKVAVHCPIRLKAGSHAFAYLVFKPYEFSCSDQEQMKVQQFETSWRIDIPSEGSVVAKELEITASCPVDLIVSDPQMHTISKTASTISDAMYLEGTFDGGLDVEDRVVVAHAKKGVYSVQILPDASSQEDSLFSIFVKYLGHTDTLVFEGIISELPLQPLLISTLDTGSIHCGVLSAKMGLLGVQVNLLDSTSAVKSISYTDKFGSVQFAGLPNGKYFVEVVTPLGYCLIPEVKVAEVGGLPLEIGFDLLKPDIVPMLRSRAYWADQLTKVLQNKRADFTKAQFSRFSGLISQHFNDNLLNSVATFVVPQPASQNDSLVMMKKLLTFGCTEVNEPFLKKVAKAELVALMLNVAAGKVSQTHIVTHDAATLSQAITYCDMLINEVDCPIGNVPAWFMPGYPNRLEIMRYLKAAFVAGLINIGVTLPSGQIPLDIMNIAYKESATPPIPTDFELSQNHPNPFNPITTIRFAIPQAGNVQLEVLNVIGQRVRTLVDETKPAGAHEVQWDGRDSNGNAVSSGVYLYRIKIGEFTETKKMVLMK